MREMMLTMPSINPDVFFERDFSVVQLHEFFQGAESILKIHETKGFHTLHNALRFFFKIIGEFLGRGGSNFII